MVPRESKWCGQALGLTLVLLSAAGVAWAEVIYVDDDALLGGDGQTWQTAYKHLQDALIAAVSGDKVWVAAGMYRPDQDEAGSVTPGDRNSAFKLRNNVAIYGGFVGGETELNQRPVDPDPLTIDLATDSVLSGDIGIQGQSDDNCYHVFYHPSGTNLDSTAVLDGFTITGGRADGSAASSSGGGMYNYDDSSPMVTNCTFMGNSAEFGGGLYCYDNASTIAGNTIAGNAASGGHGGSGGGIYCADASLTIVNNTIIGNSAGSGGGGGYCNGGSPTIVNNTVEGNTAENWGGGVCCSSSLTISGGAFRNNSAPWGGGVYAAGGGLTIEGCTFEQNRGGKSGGGLCNENGVLAVRSCLFRENSAWAEGGGLIIRSGAAVIEGSRFLNNSAGWWGGGVHLTTSASAKVIGCLLAGNSAWRGAGLQVDGGNHAVINCVLSGNHSTGGGDYGGGAICVSESGRLTITNCTCVGNLANSRGGGVYILPGGHSTIQNSIIWQNSDSWGNGEASQIWAPVGAGPPVVTHCCVQGWSGAWGGPGNTGTDPLLSDADGPDDVMGTEDDDVRLEAGSLSVDAGKNDVDTNAFNLEHEPLPDADYAGHPRFLDDPQTVDTGDGIAPLVDRGAFELVPPDCNDNGILDVDDVTLGSSQDCNGNAIPDECELDCNGNGLHDTCDIAGGADDCDSDGVPDECESDGDGDGFIDECDNCPRVYNPLQDPICEIPSNVVCVKADALGAGDGTDWLNAFNSLQDALALAQNSNGSINELWVAAGTYHPDDGVGLTPGDRSATFQLVDGISIYGGFAGTETQRDQRDPSVYLATLSGDIGLEDVQTDNSRHVVTTNDGVGPGMVVDGFRIVRGYAEGGDADGAGAGWYNNGGSPTIVNCVFWDHYAADGGGFYTASGDPTITDCGFRHSTAYWGGGVHVSGGRPRLERCTFEQNHAKKSGGGLHMYTENGPLVVRDCLFRENTAWAEGAGLQIRCGSVVIEGTRFVDNSAGWWGGGVHLAADASSAKLIGCLLAGNVAWDGAGLRTDGTNHTVINCVFSGNHSTGGGDYGGAGIAVSHSSLMTITNCTFAGNQADNRGGAINIYVGGRPTIQNSIFWQNRDFWGSGENSQIWFPVREGPPVVAHCCVQGWSGVWGGTGNTGDAPLWTPNRHLRAAASSFIDTGDNGAVPIDVASDIDGQPEVRIFNGTVDIGADEFNDSDDDGLPDWWEATYPDAADPGGDFDQDGLPNLVEYELFSSNPIAPPYYVDQSAPNASDDNPGTFALPLATIQEGLCRAKDGDTVLVVPGTYPVPSGGLNYLHKSVVVRRCDVPGICDAPEEAILHCPAETRVVDTNSIQGVFGALDGFKITGTSGTVDEGIRTDGSRFMLRNCVLVARDASTAGGGLYSTSGFPRLDGLTIRADPGSSGGAILSSEVELEGELRLEGDQLDVSSSWFTGPGNIFIDFGRLLRITGTPGAAATVVRVDMLGLGNIQIDAGQSLRIENGAEVDLSGGAGGNCDTGCITPDPSQWGTITVDGALVVRDATIRNANVQVTLADLEGNNSIINNDISLVEATIGFGGQFFVSGTTTVECNNVFSLGDRYLDLDPDPDDRNLRLCGNKISVQISQGLNSTLGTVFELRGLDHDCGTATNPGCESGAFAAPGFTADPSANWVLDELEILTGAKLNLTNRPGFQFQTDTTYPETVYVKTLKLHPDAVLNTALQTLYYQELVDESDAPLARDPGDPAAPMVNGSRIVDEPLLGFSLGVIAFDDETAPPHNEFDIRIRSRLRDSQDQQPCTCEGVCPDNNPPKDIATCLEGSVVQLDDSQVQQEEPSLTQIGGLMDMRTQADDRQAVASVAAKGAFARAGDEDIVVTFEYLFRQAEAGTRINVYLSDRPSVGDSIYRVAELTPPPPDMPGGINSDHLALFRGRFPRVAPGLYELNFTRGTYVELELVANENEQGTRAPGIARVWINNFDPQVVCPHGLCGVFHVSSQAEPQDYLILLAEMGQASPTGKWCLDLSEDGYIDLGDALAWDLVYNNDATLCPDAPSAALLRENGKPAMAVESGTLGIKGRLLIAGKPNDPESQEDYLYNVTSDTGGSSPRRSPACPAGSDCTHGLARLVRDADGTLYMVHGVHGLLKQEVGPQGEETAVAAVSPALKTYNGRSVVIGGVFPDGEFYGVPLSDAAVAKDDVTGSTDVYVVPVLVTVPAAGDVPEHSYKAAARLRLGSTSTDYTVQAVFGLDPIADDPNDCANCKLTVPGGTCTPLCDLTNAREIEVDADGNVFVASGTAYNDNDWILIYNEASGEPGFEIARVNLNQLCTGGDYPAPASPGALLVSSHDPGKLYLAASANPGHGLSSHVYRFSIASGATVLTWDGVVAINADPNAIPDICSDPYVTCTDYVSAITSIQEDVDGTLYLVGLTAPRFPEADWVTDYVDRIFTTPMLATVWPDPQKTTWSTSLSSATLIEAIKISGGDLTLPTSAVLRLHCAADFDRDGDVDLDDLAVFQACATGPDLGPPTSVCEMADFDQDNDVDQRDFGVFQRCVSGPDISADANCAD